MFDRFDESARRTVVAARQASTDFAVDTCHLLHGMLMAAGPAADVLTTFGVTVETLNDARPLEQPQLHGPFAPETRRVLEAALADSLAGASANVTALHLLCAVAEFPTCTGALTLDALRVDRASMAARARARIQTDQAAGGTQAVGHDGRPRIPARKALDAFTVDLVAEAVAGRLDPVIGRDQELEQVIMTLCRRTKPNPLLVGPAGVGKTAIVEGLAQRIADGTVPEPLAGKRLCSLDLGLLMAGTRLRGDLEERAKAVIAEAVAEGAVLFADEMHALIGDSSSSRVDLGQLLKPSLGRGDLHMIGATTDDEYRIVERDEAFARRFSPVRVAALTPDAAEQVLAALAPKLSEHHQVGFSAAAQRRAVEMASRHLVDRHLPDSAIDILDEAGAAWAIRRARGVDAGSEVGVVDIDAVVAAMTGVDVAAVSGDRSERLLSLELDLATRVIGQAEAVSVVAAAARRSGAGLRDRERPVVSLLFCGPSGVGKTLTAKLLAEAFYGDADAITTFDMSEYPEAHDVARLIGAPPGYVGFDEGGRLVEAIRRRRAQVLLFDEAEKADPKVFDLLLGLLEEGRVRGGDGTMADARECVIVLTSNLGTENLSRQVGFTAGAGTQRSTRVAAVQEALSRFFRPELCNRLDATVVFDPLSVDDLAAVARLELAALAGRLLMSGATLGVGPGVAEAVAAAAARGEAGARGVRRAVERIVEQQLVDLRLRGLLGTGTHAQVTCGRSGSVNVDVDVAAAVAGEPAIEAA
jgi:ATP-dependent Clp protease ATP-binding subunit ClpC